MKTISTYNSLALPIICLLFWSCAGSRGAVRKSYEFDSPAAEKTFPYRLGPGDVLRLFFRVIDADSGYRFHRGDDISVTFYSNPELDKVATVQPDGSVLLPPKQAISAEGKSAEELGKSLEELFADVVKDPMIFTKVVQPYQESRRVLQLLSHDRGGIALSVDPDGSAALPYVEPALVAGLSVDEAQGAILAHYRDRFPGLSVSLALERAVNNGIFVFGEVRQPGTFPLESTPTLTAALARSQVSVDVAGLRSVLVMSREGNRTVSRFVDVNRILSRGNIGLDVTLRQYDVVFVPKKPIAVVDLFVKQYINDVIPQVFRFGLGWSVDINDLLK